MFILGREEGKEPEEPWDVFREGADDDEALSCAGCYECSKKFLKVFFIVVTFCMVFGSIVVSKMSIVMITSNLVSNGEVEQFVAVTNDSCHVRPVDGRSECGVPLCPEDKSNEVVAGIRWMWALCLCIATPYVIGLLRSLRQIVFKKKESPKLRSTITVSEMS